METVFDKNHKIVIAILVLIAILSMSVSSFAATLYTSGLKKGDKLKFSGTSWTVYSTKAAAKKANGSAKRYLKNGETITLVSIATDCNVIKIANDEYIYYGATASQYFKKVESAVKVTGITLNKTSATLDIGKTLTLKATIKPTNASNKNITWSSDNTSVATVKDGIVTTKKVGTATITATAADGSGKKATCTITVTEPKITVTGVTINGKTNASQSIRVGYTIELKSAVTPSNANQNVTWTSSNKNVATVDTKGNVTSKSAGTAVITAASTQDKNKKATYTITVIQQVEKLELEQNVYQITKDKSIKINATIKPANAQSDDIEWSIENSKIAKIASISKNKKTVKITGLKTGETKLTAKVRTTEKSNGYKTVTAKIKVIIPVTKVTIITENRTMEKGKTATLKAKVAPDNATNKTLKWTSSDSKIVKIEDANSGKITAVGVGTATITAISTDGTEKKATFQITVRDTSKNYTYANNKYTIAVTKEKLDSVLKTIYDKHLYQKGSTYLSGRCGYVACYHVKLLVGAENEEYAKNTKAYNCSYGTIRSYNDAKTFWSTIKTNIDNGRAMRIRVSNTSYSQHFVTIVGYKGSCSGFDDLLMIGAYTGKLMVYNGDGAAEINNGRNGYQLRY